MATLTNTPDGQTSRLVTWAALANGDIGPWLDFSDYGGDATLTVGGTFGTGGSVSLEGSNDGTNAFALTDPQGNAITKTSAGGNLLTEAPRYVRPNCTAGDGTTDTVQLYIRRIR